MSPTNTRVSTVVKPVDIKSADMESGPVLAFTVFTKLQAEHGWKQAGFYKQATGTPPRFPVSWILALWVATHAHRSLVGEGGVPALLRLSPPPPEPVSWACLLEIA